MTVTYFNEFIGSNTVYLTGLSVTQQFWKVSPETPGSEARPISDHSDRTGSDDNLSSD